MRCALTAVVLFWYFGFVDIAYNTMARMGPFPTREVCEAIRNVPIRNAPNAFVERRLTVCWWVPEPGDVMLQELGAGE